MEHCRRTGKLNDKRAGFKTERQMHTLLTKVTENRFITHDVFGGFIATKDPVTRQPWGELVCEYFERYGTHDSFYDNFIATNLKNPLVLLFAEVLSGCAFEFLLPLMKQAHHSENAGWLGAHLEAVVRELKKANSPKGLFVHDPDLDEQQPHEVEDVEEEAEFGMEEEDFTLPAMPEAAPPPVPERRAAAAGGALARAGAWLASWWGGGGGGDDGVWEGAPGEEDAGFSPDDDVRQAEEAEEAAAAAEVEELLGVDGDVAAVPELTPEQRLRMRGKVFACYRAAAVKVLERHTAYKRVSSNGPSAVPVAELNDNDRAALLAIAAHNRSGERRFAHLQDDISQSKHQRAEIPEALAKVRWAHENLEGATTLLTSLQPDVLRVIVHNSRKHDDLYEKAAERAEDV